MRGNAAVSSNSEIPPGTSGADQPRRRRSTRAARTDPGGTPSPAPSTPSARIIDAHFLWERQLAKLASIDLAVLDAPAVAAVCRRMAYLEGLLFGVRPRTRDGAKAQVRYAAAMVAQDRIGEPEKRRRRAVLATVLRASDADDAPLHR
jgi:hypothetical protein